MANVETTIKNVLTTGTASVSAKVYPLCKPMEETIPAVIYRRITSNVKQYHKSVGVAGLPKQDRFQITCMEESYTELIALQALVDASLVGNITDFSAVQPIGEAIEDKEEAGKVYTSMKDYYIWHKT